MKAIIITILILMLATLLACSFTVNVPTVTVSDTQTLTVDEPLSADVDTYQVNISMGAGKLTLAGGSQKLMEGTVVYNVENWKPTITRLDGQLTLKQDNTTNVGIPSNTIKNEWNLRLGPVPMELGIVTGASESDLDLSGLSISKLSITDGASSAKVRFDTANPLIMDSLTYKTGASQVELTGLSNSNAQVINFEAGVGSYTLDFTGFYGHDMTVNIKAGVSQVKLIFPVESYVKVINNGALSDINVNGTWMVNNNTYTYGEHHPLITVNVDMGLGSLDISVK